MLFGKFIRKKPRQGGAYRAPQQVDAGADRARRMQWFALALAFVVFVVAITHELTPTREQTLSDIIVGEYASENVQAQFQFESEDLALTEERKNAAAAAEPDQYNVIRARIEEQLEILRARIDYLMTLDDEVAAAIDTALRASDSSMETEQVVRTAVAGYALTLGENPQFKGITDPAGLALWLMPTPEAVPGRVFEPEAPPAEAGDGELVEPAPPRPVSDLTPAASPFEFAHVDLLTDLAVNGLEYVLNFGLMAESDYTRISSEDPNRMILIRRDRTFIPVEPKEVLALQDTPVAVEKRDGVRKRILAMPMPAEGVADPDDWAQLQNAAAALAGFGVAATLEYDDVATALARAGARSAVPTQMRTIPKNKELQAQGEAWTPQSKRDVEIYRLKRQGSQERYASTFQATIAHMILVALALMSLVRSSAMLGVQKEGTSPNLNLVLLIMGGTLILGRIVPIFDPRGFAVPVAAGGILLAILISGRVATMASFLTAGLVSVQFGYEWRVFVVGCAMSLAGIFSIYKVRRRSAMARAALQATLVGLLTLLAIALAKDELFTQTTFNLFGLLILNGVVCLFVVPGLLSPLERLFGITTDLQLLEYSDLNNELLSRMAIEVPATFSHALTLGQISEAAADAIGANGLLARVCAYYHDIGKLRRPSYFSENQGDDNVHDELSPRMSARAIAAHVTQGAEMARDHHLPKPIVAGILEHHGTCHIGFFYDKAIEQRKHGDLREADFRYPGPKPQSRETAILMICDAVESGTRSIKNPNEERVREFVDKIVSGRAADRQFDESDLTLKDLDTIAQVVTKRVMTGLHTRVAYPDKPAEKAAPNVIPLAGGPES